MSEWLQQLGKRSINAADISDQNYEELERLEHDGVKQVNDANDAFIQDLQSQVSADVQFYQAWFGNKFQQYKDLGPLSTQIANVTNKALEMEKVGENLIMLNNIFLKVQLNLKLISHNMLSQLTTLKRVII